MGLVFVSYSHTDSAVADQVVEMLEGLGLEYFRDVKNIELGDSVPTSVRRGLKSAAAVIVIISPGSQKSHWVSFEIGFATGRSKRVIPFLTHPALDVPAFIQDLLYTKSLEDLRKYLEAKADSIKGADKRPTAKKRGKGVQTVSLTDFQTNYLMTISRPRNEGQIWGDIDSQGGREIVDYQEALALFQKLGLMEYASKGYRLTRNGWKLADELWKLKILDVLEVDLHMPAVELAKRVELTDGEQEMKELERLVALMKDQDFVSTLRSSDGLSVCLTQNGATHRKHRPIDISEKE